MKTKTTLLVLMSLAMVAFTSCGEDESETLVNNDRTTITFNVKGLQITMEQTRATMISDAFPMLELALYKKNDDGTYTKYMDVSQENTNPSYGSITLENVRCGTYKLVTIGHNDSSHPDISDPKNITFENYPNTYSYSNDIVVTKTTTSYDVPLEHSSARIRFQLSGYIPDEVKKMQYTIQGASNSLNAITGFAASKGDRVIEVDITDSQRTSKSITGSAYIFLEKDELTSSDSYVNVTIAGLKSNNEVVDSKTYNNVPLKVGYATIFSGVFFEYGNASFNITVNTSWGTYETIDL